VFCLQDSCGSILRKVFLTLEPPTRPMKKEAASARFYTLGNRQYPRLRIITVK